MDEPKKTHIPTKRKIFVYLMHCFTTLSARMWWFGIGMFLIEVSPESLQLTAIYGFTSGSAMLLFAAVIGDWIDKSTRLKAARFALIANNLSIVVCCIVVIIVLLNKPRIAAILDDEWMLKICFAIIVIITIVTNLCNLGRTIILERDWIVEICERDTDMIATMSATFRVIDLCSKVVAPLATGQIMTYVSPVIGSVFIACWNVASLLVEYLLVWKVYSLVPALHTKHKEVHTVKESAPFNPIEPMMKEHVSEVDRQGSHENPDVQIQDSTDRHDPSVVVSNRKNENKSTCQKIFSNLISLYRGWSHYHKYDVAIAGWALAFLYFTVLGFDNITIGYAVTQGMTESLLGILIGCAAVFGIIASISYPFIRKKIGLERSGVLGLSCQISALSLCIISLWLPGSTFDPLYWSRNSPANLEKLQKDCQNNSIVMNVIPTSDFDLTRLESINSSLHQNDVIFSTLTPCNTTSSEISEPPKSKVSLILLYTGILGARFGVWLADLTITQLFLENVAEKERGIVNGFQSALNKMMDMLKFVMVILIPHPETFGYPAMISFCFICTAWILYSRYTYKTLGYLCCR